MLSPLENCCRICMLSTDDGLVSIFDKQIVDNISIWEKLSAINIHLINNQRYPKNICFKCNYELNAAFNFREKSQHSEKILYSLISLDEGKINFQNELYLVQPSEVKTEEFDIQSECTIKIEEEDRLEIKSCLENDSKKTNKQKPCCATQKRQECHLICKICSKLFLGNKLLNRHIARHIKRGEINQMSPVKNEKEMLSQTPNINNASVRYECDRCSMCFKTDYSLKSHFKISHKEFIIPESDSPTEAFQKVELFRFYCGYCNRDFHQKRHLRRHMLRMHINPISAKVKCSIENCAREFRDQNCMDAHRFRQHGNNCCQLCSKTFQKFANLQTHISAVHKKKRNFLCDVCAKSFMSISSLNEHQLSHASGNSYSCDQCSKEYRSKSSLFSHIKSFHKGIKPYACDFEGPSGFCESKFKCPSDLKSHQRGHTGEKPFQCSFCAKCFRDSKDRHRHHRTHTGERPHKCPYENCDKAFAQKGDLNLHQRIHTGLKPHKCHCGASFRQPSTLKTHQKVHQKVENNVFRT